MMPKYHSDAALQEHGGNGQQHAVELADRLVED